MIRKLLLIGGGGHCKSIIESLQSHTFYDNISIIDRPANVGKKVLGIDIIGTDEELSKLRTLKYTDAFISVGSVGDVQLDAAA